MKLAEVVRWIEAYYNGNMNGVSVLVCGAADLGKLAITLARHSARVVLLTENSSHYKVVVDDLPQALNMEALHTDVSTWIADNAGHVFDEVVFFDCCEDKALTFSCSRPVVNLHYADGDYLLIDN